MRLRNLLLVILAASLAGSLLLLAQPQQPPPGSDQDYGQGTPAEDPPSRAARLSLINGNVSYQPGSVEEWAQAAINHPLTIGDRLYTEDGGRAELALGSASIRLNSRTAFSFLNLDDQTTQIQISQGTVSVRIRRLEQDEIFEIDTPQSAFTITRPGEYRVDVSENGDATVITVRGGEGELTAGGESFIVPARQQIRITGTDQVAYDRRDMPPADVFDNWCADRDRREDRSISARYVSQDIPGYADLDDNGTWSNVPEYGDVWAPRVDADWSPYSRGHWAWVSPWGWTWVDDEPWGYAPFHYGRWAFYSSRWVWVPGPRLGRPVYSPALVAWVGGGGFSVGIGGGPAVGWFALGPREVYYPSYRYSPRYIERVNVTNTVIVDRRAFASRGYAVNTRFVNRDARNGVVVVRQETLVGGRPVREGYMRVSPDVIRSSQVVRTAAVVPTRAAVFSGRAMVGRAPSVTVVNRTVVARRPPPSRPVTFDRQQTELRSNPGRPLDRGSYNRLQGSQPAAQPPVRLMDRPRQGGRTDQPGFQQRQQQQPQVTPQQQQQQQPQRTDRPSRFPQQQQQQQPQVTPQQQQQQPQRTDRPSRFPQQQQQQPQPQATPPPQVTPQQQQQSQPQRTDRPSRFPQQQQQPQVTPTPTPQQQQQQQQQERQRQQRQDRPERVPQQQQPQPQAVPPPQPRVVTPTPQQQQQQQQQERQRQQRQERPPQPQPQPQAVPPPQPRVVTPPPQQQQQQQRREERQQQREQKQQQREEKRDDKKDKKQ